MQDQQELNIETLRRLAHICQYNKENFFHAAERCEKPELKDMFIKYFEQCSFYVEELKNQINFLGGNPDDEQSDLLLHLNDLWMKIRTSFTHIKDNDESLLKMVKSSEESLLKAYDDELKGHISESFLRPILINQRLEIAKSLHEIDRLYFEQFPPAKNTI